MGQGGDGAGRVEGKWGRERREGGRVEGGEEEEGRGERERGDGGEREEGMGRGGDRK